MFGGVAIGVAPWYHALDGATGEVLWQGAAGPSYAASAAANGVVFAGALDFTVKAFDAATGRLLWLSPALGAVSSGPAIVGDMVLIGSGTSTSDACAKDLPGLGRVRGGVRRRAVAAGRHPRLQAAAGSARRGQRCRSGVRGPGLRPPWACTRG